MEKFKEQITVTGIVLDVDVLRVVDELEIADPSEIHVWLSDEQVTLLTASDKYTNCVRQMQLMASRIKTEAANLAAVYDIEITEECFGVKDGRMYFLYFGICK